MTYILHRMATHPKNYVYVKRWRDKNKARYDPMNSKYATRSYHWKKISKEFMSIYLYFFYEKLYLVFHKYVFRIRFKDKSLLKYRIIYFLF